MDLFDPSIDITIWQLICLSLLITICYLIGKYVLGKKKDKHNSQQ